MGVRGVKQNSSGSWSKNINEEWRFDHNGQKGQITREMARGRLSSFGKRAGWPGRKGQPARSERSRTGGGGRRPR